MHSEIIVLITLSLKVSSLFVSGLVIACLSFENISVNLKEIQTRDINETNKTLNDNISGEVIDKNKLEIAKLVIYKFENNLDYSDELNILQNFNDDNTQHIFEKINLVKLKNYRGNTFLKNIYSQELDLYLKYQKDEFLCFLQSQHYLLILAKENYLSRN